MGLAKDMELDRIDNNGHYEPGNIRYVNKKINMNNTRRRRLTPAMHAFRQRHPNIKYADATLVRMIGENMTDEQIIAAYHKGSCKPKGVYGTFSTPDPDILSLSKDS